MAQPSLFDSLLSKIKSEQAWARQNPQVPDAMLKGGHLEQPVVPDVAPEPDVGPPQVPYQMPPLSHGFAGPSSGQILPGTPTNPIYLDALEQVPPMLDKDYMAGQLENGSLPVPTVTPAERILASLSPGEAKTSSRKKAIATGGAARQTGEVPEAGDQIKDMLLGREGQATKDRDSALAKAEGEKSMSDEEKVVMSLLATLPAIIGGIGGAAISGGRGAAEGIAGGLQGSGAGIGMLNDARAARVKEAKGEAALAQGRIDSTQGQLLGHQEHVGDQSFAKTQQNDQQAFTAELQAKSQKHATGLELQREFAAAKLADKNNAADLAQKMAAAKATGKSLTEHQGKLQILLPQIIGADKVMTAMDLSKEGPPQADTVSNLKNKAESLVNMEDSTYRDYDDASTGLSQHYTFAVSGATAPPEEVKRLKRVFEVRPNDTPVQRAHRVALRHEAVRVISAIANGERPTNIPEELQTPTASPQQQSNQQKFGF